nr:phosphatase PAP2 family protein [candidate division Zixibacteria bacterium]
MSKCKIYPFDIIILIYLSLLSILILLFGRPLYLYFDELLFNLGITALILMIIRYLSDTDRKIVLLFRLLYPAVLFTFFYRETGGLMHLIFPDFLDYQLTGLERSFFGDNPTLWLDRNLLNVWLTEILSLTYFLYYPMIPVFLLMAFIKKEYLVIEKSLAAICLTFFICYLIFIFYPIEGPRYFFAEKYINSISGPIFRPMVELVQAKGSVHGGAMPSSHFGEALVMLIFCLKYYKKAAIIFLVIDIGMALGTFYGRYHYVSDVIVGGIIGSVVTIIVMKYYERWFITTDKTCETEEKAVKYVS